MVSNDRRSRRAAARQEKRGADATQAAADGTLIAAETVNVHDLMFDQPSLHMHESVDLDKDSSEQGAWHTTASSQASIIEALVHLPSPARRRAPNSLPQSGASLGGEVPPLLGPSPASRVPAPWELPVENALLGHQVSIENQGPRVSYREQLRASGQQALQRAWDRGIMPKATQQQPTAPCAPPAPPAMPPAFGTAPAMGMAGSLPHNGMCSSGTITPGSMTPGGMSASSIMTSGSILSLPPGSIASGNMMPGSMTPGNMTPGSSMTPTMSSQSPMADPFGLCRSAPMPTSQLAQCQWSQGTSNHMTMTAAWEEAQLWPSEAPPQMPPPPPAAQPPMPESQHKMMAATMVPMQQQGPNVYTSCAPTPTLMSIAMPQAADCTMNSEQIAAQLMAAVPEQYED